MLAAIGVERVAHACQAAGLMGAATSAQACRFCGLVSRLATIRGGAASVGNLAEVTLGASVLVRAGCGEGECGGARLMGSEKSPIVTLSAVRGAGRADRERTDEDCVLPQNSRVGPQSSVGMRSPRRVSQSPYGAGMRRLTRPEPSVTLLRPGRFARQVARGASVLQVSVAGHCRPREWTATHQG